MAGGRAAGAVCSTAVMPAAASLVKLTARLRVAVSHDGSMARLDWIRRCATGLGVAVAVAVAPVTAQAHGDDPNPLLELADAATQRLQTADPVAQTKWINGGSIEDPPRVEQVLKAVSADATAKGVDPDYVEQIFTDQVHATEAVEYSRF